MRIMIAGAAALAAALLAGPLAAQNATVNVNLSEVTDQMAEELAMDVSHIPPVVEAPLDVAAEACGLPESDLQGLAACIAETTSPELNEIARRGMGH